MGREFMPNGQATAKPPNVTYQVTALLDSFIDAAYLVLYRLSTLMFNSL